MIWGQLSSFLHFTQIRSNLLCNSTSPQRLQLDLRLTRERGTQFSCPSRYVTGAIGDGSGLDFVEIPQNFWRLPYAVTCYLYAARPKTSASSIAGRVRISSSRTSSGFPLLPASLSPPRLSCDRCSSRPRRLRLPEAAEQSQAEKRGAEEGHGCGLRHGTSDAFYHGDIVQTI